MRTAGDHQIMPCGALVQQCDEGNHANGLHTQDNGLQRGGDQGLLRRRSHEQFGHGTVERIPNNLVTDRRSQSTIRQLLSILYVIIMKPLSKQLQVTKGHPEAGHISKESPPYTLHRDTGLLYTDIGVQAVPDHKGHLKSGP